jgi:uncharacterized protein (DUF433 family)
MPTTEVLRTAQSWIQKTAEVSGGDACIRDTRIPVWALVVARRRGVTDEDFRHYFVTPLASADVEAAWTYYREHPDEIDLAIRQHEEA